MPERTITIAHEDLQGSPVERGNADSFTAQRQVICAYADRLELFRQLVGGMEGTTFYLPAPYPSRTDARVSDVSIRPFHSDLDVDDDGNISYQKAQLDISYEIPSWGESSDDPSADDLMSESLSFATEFLTVPGQDLFWQSGTADEDQGRPVGESPAIPINLTEWKVTLHRVTQIPLIATTWGSKTNATAITSRKFNITWPAETIRYDGLTTQAVTTTEGVTLEEPVLSFKIREQSWNKSFRPETETWEYMYTRGSIDPYKPFEPVNLMRLFNGQ